MRQIVNALFLSVAMVASASTQLFQGANSHINQLLQDRDGYIWLATDNGLSRYDGCNVRTFARNAGAPSLLNNLVLSVYEDSHGVLWVGTYDGIQRFNRETELFETPRLSYPGVPEFTYVNSITEDRQGNIWFTTSRSGLVCFGEGDSKPRCYMTTNSGICSDKTTEVFEDKFGNIWVGSYGSGLSILNPSNNTIENHSYVPGDPTSLSGNNVFSIAQGPDGQVYVATLDGGVDTYNYRTHRFVRGAIGKVPGAFVLRADPSGRAMYVGTDGYGIYRYDYADATLESVSPDVKDFDIRRSKVHDILFDRDGNTWAGVYQKGAVMMSGDADGVENYRFNAFDKSRSIGTEPVLAIMRDADGDMWIGTDGAGVYHSRSGAFRQIPLPPHSAPIVSALYQDAAGRIWAGEFYGGLSRYNPAADAFVAVDIVVDGRPLSDINTIAEDDNGRLWIGTNGGGICIYDPVSGATEVLRHRAEGQSVSQICGNSIHTIFFDHTGGAWIGTSDAGMTCIRPDGRYEQFCLGDRRLNSNCVYSIVEDAVGVVWIGTAIGLVSVRGNVSTIYNVSNGMDEVPVYGILIDSDNRLWLSTTAGISEFDSDLSTVVRRVSADRAGCREFKRGAAYTDSRGRMFFGGVGGVVAFEKDSFDSTLPEVTPRLQYLAYRDSRTGEVTELPLATHPEVRLDHATNSFAVSFGSCRFNNPDEVHYAVLLDKYSKTWQEVPAGTQSWAFSNVPPGNYTLRVRARAGDSEAEDSIPLVIVPPFYRSSMAYGMYALLLIASIGLLVSMWRRRQMNTIREQARVQKEELNEQKLQFFTDISHEVRTPLTLILSPLATLRRTTTDRKTLRIYEMMESNGRRILRMMDQVIDLRKFDNSSMRLQVESTDIREFLSALSRSFINISGTRDITFEIDVDEAVPERVMIDRDKIDKVLFNVLANAFRFTPVGGAIRLQADIDGTGDLRIRIIDNGPGIPPEYHNTIFKRFYQVKDSGVSGGTGIGLNLSLKMMEAHHGSIFVERSDSTGTAFAIIIPIREDAYAPDEIRVAPVQDVEAEEVEGVYPGATVPAGIIPAPVSDSTGGTVSHKAFTVLVVEDDSSIADYLLRMLRSEYNVITVGNGEEGIEAALKYRPHCIVTDLSMPGMDGLEMCRKIRSNDTICEIPIIVVTARAGDEHRIEGLEAGADAYITKPFSIDHLITRIQTLIHSRRVMKQKFTSGAMLNEEVAGIKSGDEKLLERIEAVVVREIANPDLSVDFIAREIGVSRSHLHRRLKVLSNVSPSTYIKQARMRHAAVLLAKKNVAISEVAYATGFSSLSHFSTVFKEFYGMSPTRYVTVNGGVQQSDNE